MIRFNITKGETTFQTDWVEEEKRVGPTATATLMASQLRREHGPEARIVVERDPVPERQPQEWVQFTLTHKAGSSEPEGTRQMTNAVLKSQADGLMAELRRDYPETTITRREWTK